MRVKDVMVHEIGMLHPDDQLRHASETIKGLGLEPLPVWDGCKVVGMITSTDIGRRAAAAGLSAGGLPVKEAMQADLAVCHEDDEIPDALEVLKQRGEALPGLLVMDRAERVVGVIPAADLRAGEENVLPRMVGAVGASEPKVCIERDPVDHRSEASYPASDPPPPPSTMAPCDPED